MTNRHITKAIRRLAIPAALAITSGSALASIFSLSAAGAFATDTTYSIDFATAAATQANLSFDLLGFNSIDGNHTLPGDLSVNFDDTFTLAIDGTNVFSGMFNMGGGGYSVITLNTLGATATTYTNGCGSPCYAVTDGGNTVVSLNSLFGAGSHHVTFSYTSLPGYNQGTADETWGLKNVLVTSVPEPETYAMLLAGLAILGTVVRRRRNLP